MQVSVSLTFLGIAHALEVGELLNICFPRVGIWNEPCILCPGGEVAENSQGGWTGSRTEVAEQIQKVRDTVSNKHRRQAGTTEHETASS